MSTARTTQYGFDWGPARIERLCHIEGRGYVLEIRTDHARLQVHVTEKGRKISTHFIPSTDSGAAATTPENTTPGGQS